MPQLTSTIFTSKVRLVVWGFLCWVVIPGYSQSAGSSIKYAKAKESLNSLMDTWHKNATLAKFESYFAATSEDFVFYGTAPAEKWDKKGFMAFSKPYFDSTKTWRFTPSNRVWYFSENGKTAWFDEDLETWMLDCRGSGICTKTRQGWKLSYYNLSVVIENEKIKEFIELRKF